jgi:hypothetical protein
MSRHLFLALSVDWDWTEVWLTLAAGLCLFSTNHDQHFTVEHRLTFYSHKASYLKHQLCIWISTCSHINFSPSPAEQRAERWNI